MSQPKSSQNTAPNWMAVSYKGVLSGIGTVPSGRQGSIKWLLRGMSGRSPLYVATDHGLRLMKEVAVRVSEFDWGDSFMVSRTTQLAWLTFFCAAFAFGCSKTTDLPPNSEEGRVREAFTALQSSLKARDADQLWKLLDSESQADAERAAQAVQAAYAKADAKEKSEQDKALGLPGDQLAGLTALGFLKPKPFPATYATSQST